MDLFYHPLSSYSWKVLIALYENGTPFTPRPLLDEQAAADWAALWPLGRFPVLRDGDAVVAEASIIVEYLARKAPGAFVAIPADLNDALEVRLMDRLFDNYVMSPMQAVVADAIRPEGVARDPHGVEQARALLAKAYDLIDARVAGRTWAAGEAFSLADCAGAPALFYADHVLSFRKTHPTLSAYMARLEARPSIGQVLEEKQPFFHFFPFADSKDGH